MKRSGKQGNRNLIIKKDELNFITKAMGCQGEIVLRATPSSPENRHFYTTRLQKSDVRLVLNLTKNMECATVVPV